jgi:tRNA threonylcarbamoyladenosine biosynthesis protein TsaB
MFENWLLIETSGRVGKVGLARGGGLARAAELDATRRHARDLTAAVDALLRAESLGSRDLTGVMVSVGPGSYTGLRVGVMTAKALAYATGCRLVPVGTFAAIAEQAPAEADVLWVIADALQGQVYVQRFERKPETGRLVPSHGDVTIGPVEEWLNWLPWGVWVSGPGVKVYADRNIPQNCHLAPEADREPSVAGLFAAGQHIPPATREDVFALEPLYLRGSSAEEKAKKEKPPG